MLKRLIVATGLVALLGSAASAIVIGVAVDIKPQSCPNPLNVKSNGKLSVAILGSDDFDAGQIDPSSIQLEGVSPLADRDAIEDVATPFDGPPADCEDCTEDGPDGFEDLVLKFDTQEVVAALGGVADGACVELMLTGTLFDGTPIAGTDFVVIKGKGL